MNVSEALRDLARPWWLVQERSILSARDGQRKGSEIQVGAKRDRPRHVTVIWPDPIVASGASSLVSISWHQNDVNALEPDSDAEVGGLMESQRARRNRVSQDVPLNTETSKIRYVTLFTEQNHRFQSCCCELAHI